MRLGPADPREAVLHGVLAAAAADGRELLTGAKIGDIVGRRRAFVAS